MSASQIMSTKRAVTNTAWLFSEKIITLCITFALNVFLARYLAPEQYGQYSFVIAFISLLAPFTSLGLNALVTRELVNGINQHKVMSTAFLLRLLGGVLGAIFAMSAVYFFAANISVVPSEWLIIAAIINVSSALYVIEYYFQAKVASHYLVMIRVSTLVVSSMAKAIGLLAHQSLEFFVGVFLLELVVRGTLYLSCYFFYNHKHQDSITRSNWNWDATYAKQLLSQSKWLVLSGFMSVIYMKIDQLMLGQMSGPTELGVYSVAAKLSEVWYFFPTALVASFFPKLLKSRKDPAVYHKQLFHLCGTLLWMATSLAIVVSLFSEWLIPVAFGDAYASSAAILNVHIWAGCFIFMRALLSKWLIAEGLLKFSLLTHGIAAIINVLLNLLLIPEYGGWGAAIATLISYACSSYFVLWLHPKTQMMAKVMTRSVIYPAALIKNKLSKASR